MKYNKSEIMKAAWADYRESTASRALMGFAPLPFATFLRIAWNIAKTAPKTAAVVELESRLFALDCKDRWTNEDYALSDELRRLIREQKAS